MPEGPELHVAGKFVNRVSDGRIYSGKVVKSAVSTKNPDIPWDEPAYIISATTRGKEIRLTLTEADVISEDKKKKNVKKAQKDGACKKEISILFRFGMSGKFLFKPKSEMDKHNHLNFFSRDDDMVLSFNDYRRFGRWEVTDKWGKDRGPCIILEYDLFRSHVLQNLNSAAFNKPICEVMLNQKFFNGTGNYLRAEILYRLEIPPFALARTVLEPIREADEAGVKTEDDLLKLCNVLPHEVLNLNDGRGHLYDPRDDAEGFSGFLSWLRCYYQDGMNNLVDHNGRTVWFKGPAGPLKPKGVETVRIAKTSAQRSRRKPCRRPIRGRKPRSRYTQSQKSSWTVTPMIESQKSGWTVTPMEDSIDDMPDDFVATDNPIDSPASPYTTNSSSFIDFTVQPSTTGTSNNSQNIAISLESLSSPASTSTPSRRSSFNEMPVPPSIICTTNKCQNIATSLEGRSSPSSLSITSCCSSCQDTTAPSSSTGTTNNYQTIPISLESWSGLLQVEQDMSEDSKEQNNSLQQPKEERAQRRHRGKTERVPSCMAPANTRRSRAKGDRMIVTSSDSDRDFKEENRTIRESDWGVFPVGYALPRKIKKNIWTDKYVDFLEVLDSERPHRYSLELEFGPSANEPVLKLQRPREERQLSELEWCTAFNVFMAVYTQKHPEYTQQLCIYMQNITELMRVGANWRWYDRRFRSDRELRPSRWDECRPDLDRYAYTPVYQRHQAKQERGQSFSTPWSASAAEKSQIYIPEDFCYSFNSQGLRCTSYPCSFKHLCPRCDQPHPMFMHDQRFIN